MRTPEERVAGGVVNGEMWDVSLRSMCSFVANEFEVGIFAVYAFFCGKNEFPRFGKENPPRPEATPPLEGIFPSAVTKVMAGQDGWKGRQDARGTVSNAWKKMFQCLEIVIKHPDRAEAERVWNFPYAAVEEALVNAVYHRSYEVREPVEVRITPEDHASIREAVNAYCDSLEEFAG